MTATVSAELRRAQPLLGTLVEVTVRGACEAELMRAVSGAFGAVARVHRLMSFHDSRSDVGRINRLAHRVAVRVHPWTWEVLLAAQRLSQRTAGTFDVTTGGELMRLGYLPSSLPACLDRRACWRDVHLLPGQRVRLARRLCIDLGGIAKGFAVDRAVDYLRGRGVRAGLVNAGGDLRAFGSVAWRIHVRHPADPGTLIPFADIVSGALATSAGYFSRRVQRGTALSPVIDGVRRTAINPAFSASVAASSCMLADGLTKLVLLRGRRAHGLVRRLGAQAFILSAQPSGLEPIRAI
ncbi:MAG TPA: FAD:protein FMN transferase [Burkholderiales bacterium]|nr:FAD:protein FMN transferase [Burkholderiales bacterium]